MVTVTKITEESACKTTGNVCNFDWKNAATPTVSGTAWSGDQVTITGTGFGTATGAVTATLGGQAMQIDTVIDTQIEATVTALASLANSLALGVNISGKGNAKIDASALTQTGYTPTMTVTALSPAQGSKAGQVITLTGTHFPMDIGTGSL